MTTATAIEKKINGTMVRILQDDLTALALDAFVFYAREDLALGSGYGTAIQTRGGDTVKKELAALGGVRMGEAVTTSAGKLKARRIIHACGPKFQEPDLKEKLHRCVLSALAAANREGLRSIAFPPMGAGFYGVPLPLCASVMLEVIQGFARDKTSLEQIIICVTDQREFAVFREGIEKLEALN